MSVADHNTHGELDAATGQSTTGHSWDGIKELNTPLPRWWVIILYATIIWSIGYWVVYPAWPLIGDYSRGVFGTSNRTVLLEEQAKAEAARNALAAGLADADVAAIAADPKLKEIALARGKAAFGDNCAACHGIGGQGGNGFPSLADDDWLWGGTLADIQLTIQHGIRSAADPESRSIDIGMPAFGRDGMLSPEDIKTVSNHVLVLSGQEPEQGANLAAAAELFATNCASCHGEKGEGLKDMGAPALNDKVWLYSGTAEGIRKQIYAGKNGVMPNWARRLDPITVKSLAVYVHSLGGGQ